MIWGVSLGCFTNKQHQGFSKSMVWGHISKEWKVMVKVFTIPHPLLPMGNQLKFMHYNISWSTDLEFTTNGFPYDRAHMLYCKGVRYKDDIGMANIAPPFHGMRHKKKLTLHIWMLRTRSHSWLRFLTNDGTYLRMTWKLRILINGLVPMWTR